MDHKSKIRIDGPKIEDIVIKEIKGDIKNIK